MAAVAVVGLGAMGSRVARRLLESGHRVVVWNRSAGPVEQLAAAGAEAAASPAEAAVAADAVITILAGPEALRAVVQGDAGIAAAAGPEVTVIEMSTVGPDAIAWLVGALPRGTPLLDAPVLGSVAEVESGTLSIFVGGPREVADRWMSLLRSLGTPVHVGPQGSGAAAKLVANATLLGVLVLLGETLALADALAIDRATTFDVLAETPLAAQAERRRRPIESGEYAHRFSLSLGRKDAELIVEAAAARGRQVPLLEAVRAEFRAAEAAGWGDRDYSAVLGWILAGRAPS